LAIAKKKLTTPAGESCLNPRAFYSNTFMNVENIHMNIIIINIDGSSENSVAREPTIVPSPGAAY